jgi:hypothetical protein
MSEIYDDDVYNYGFHGTVPPDVTVHENVIKALDYQATHTPEETV